MSLSPLVMLLTPEAPRVARKVINLARVPGARWDKSVALGVQAEEAPTGQARAE